MTNHLVLCVRNNRLFVLQLPLGIRIQLLQNRGYLAPVFTPNQQNRLESAQRQTCEARHTRGNKTTTASKIDRCEQRRRQRDAKLTRGKQRRPL